MNSISVGRIYFLAAFAVAILIIGKVVWASGDETPPGFAVTSSPSPCPVSAQLVFVSDAAGSSDLWLLDRSSGRGRQLLDWPDSIERVPDFNGNCSQIVFSSSRGGIEEHWQVWTISPDGRNPVQLTAGKGRHHFPRWSPDGNSILYSSDEGGIYALWIMAADGSGQRLLFGLPGTSLVHGSWSPTGDQIAFVGCGTVCQVYRLDVASLRAEQLTFSNDDKLGTDWGPNGILFTGDVGGRLVLLAVDGAGSPPSQITSPSPGQESDFDARWDAQSHGVVFVRVEPGGEGVWSQAPSKAPEKLTTLSALPLLGGDLNYDGCVDRTDYNILLGSVRSAPPRDLSYDLNGDGLVNLADVRSLVGRYTQPGGTPCVRP